MPILIPCPCGRQVQARDEHAGMQVRCPICGRTLLVPPRDRPTPVAPVTGQGQASTPQETGAARDQGRYWLLIRGSPQGPFTVEQLRSWLAAGQVVGCMLACLEGNNRWQPLAQLGVLDEEPLPEVLPAREPSSLGGIAPTGNRQPEALYVAPISPEPAAAVPLQRPSPPSRTAAPSSPARAAIPGGASPEAALAEKKPWNPVTVAWLGLLFSPVWCAVMAALNGRRLCPDLPQWRPLAIGFGSAVLFILIGMVYDSYLVDLLLYAGAVGLIWFLDLRPQQEAFRRFCREQPGAAAGWVWPSLAGVPLAVLVFLVFVVVPLLPLGPREVCDRFEAAQTAKEKARYTTNNLYPALDTLAKLEPPKGESHFEYTEEGPAPPDFGGYLVGFRAVFVERGRAMQVEGDYHLVQRIGEWKIEDIYFTRVDQQPLEHAISLARDYPLLREPSQQQLTSGGSGPSRVTPASSSSGKSQTKGIEWWRTAGGFWAAMALAVIGIVRWLAQKLQPRKGSA